MQRNSTIGELMERKRIQDGAKEYQGHTYMDLARFDDATKHMIICQKILENAPEVGCATYRSRIYKISMIRMFTLASKLTKTANVRF